MRMLEHALHAPKTAVGQQHLAPVGRVGEAGGIGRGGNPDALLRHDRAGKGGSDDGKQGAEGV